MQLPPSDIVASISLEVLRRARIRHIQVYPIDQHAPSGIGTFVHTFLSISHNLN
jgi:hypothetical protein